MDLTTKQGWVDFLDAAKKVGDETLIFAKNHLNEKAIEADRDEVVKAFNEAAQVAAVVEADASAPPVVPVKAGDGLPGGAGGHGGPDSTTGQAATGTVS